jgi:hypothetical protein
MNRRAVRSALGRGLRVARPTVLERRQCKRSVKLEGDEGTTDIVRRRPTSASGHDSTDCKRRHNAAATRRHRREAEPKLGIGCSTMALPAESAEEVVPCKRERSARGGIERPHQPRRASPSAGLRALLFGRLRSKH